MENLRRRHGFGFDHSLYVDAVGKSGSLVVSWKKELLVKEEDRRVVWDRLRDIGSRVVGPWICMGDFNDVLFHSEKWGGRPKASRKVFIIPPVGSDHCALVVDLNFTDSRSPKVFKFEMFWVDHPDYKEVLRRGWEACFDDGDDSLSLLIWRLDKCRECLIRWSKDAFPNSRVSIRALNDRLKACFQGHFSVEKNALMEEIVKMIEFEWDREELYWFQRSRVSWLRFGDRNSNSGVRDFLRVLEYVVPKILEEDNDFWRRKFSILENDWNQVGSQLFKVFGFCVSWVDIIMGCVSSVSFNFLLSGKKVSEFKPGTGVRQGDPLSPYLFIIVAEVLSLMISHHVEAGDLRGVKLSRADCSMLKSILRNYYDASGQEVNFDKSCLYFSQNTPPLVRDEGLYFPNVDILEARKGYTASWAWLSILDGRRVIEEGFSWRVGNGRKVDVWSNRWIPCLEGKKLEDVALDGFPLGLKDDVEDKRVWGWSRNGVYSVKTGYVFSKVQFALVLDEGPSCSSLTPKEVWKWVWSLGISPKVKVFLWRACGSALPTREALFSRKCSSSPLCQICGLMPETIEHCLLWCSWAREVWENAPFSLAIDNFVVKRFDLWIADLLRGVDGSVDSIMEVVAFICWEVWKYRCDFIFKGCAVDSYACYSRAVKSAFECLEASEGASRSFASASPIDGFVVPEWWVPPIPGEVKVNVDGAFLKDNWEAGIGIIFKNMDGGVRSGFYGKVSAGSSFMCKAIALRKALEMACNFHGLSFCFETDCEDLFNMVSGRRRDGGVWDCDHILGLACEFSTPSCTHPGSGSGRCFGR
ncbi:reverse transcriptase [Senna tora]|uniref:Reverse transcriptase n=1 Tax=Senna tora TaxID=362788 RepID=A0A834TFX8_9FABA|nr:reverse transcriptase [Senna tora]